MRSTHVERDPLAALRGELVSAAGRRVARRRARRRGVVAVGLIALLLAATAATAALTNLGTGVPAVDELLDVEQGYGDPSGLPAGGATRPVHVRMGDGTYAFVAFLNRRDEVVTAYAERHRDSVRGGGSGAGPRAVDLARTLARRGTILRGGSHGVDSRVFWGYADGGVERIAVEAPGDWIVKLSRPWTPPVAGGRPLRLLVVIDERDLPEGDALRAGFPPLRATYAK